MLAVKYPPQVLAFVTCCLLLLWLLAPTSSAAPQTPEPTQTDQFIYLPLVRQPIPNEYVVRIDGIGSEAIPLADGAVLLRHDEGMAGKIDRELQPKWAVEVEGESPMRYAVETAVGHIYTAGSLLNMYDRELAVLKLSHEGEVLWQRSMDTDTHDGDYPFGIAPAADGGIVVASRIDDDSSNVDGWLFLLSTDGTLAWQKAIGADGQQVFSDIAPLSDGGFIAVGNNYRTGKPSGMWLVKFDSAGNAIWQKVFSGTECVARTIRVTSQGDFIIAGNGYFGCVVRAKSNGDLVWSKVYEHAEGEISDIRPVEGQGYLVAGLAAEGLGWAAVLDGDGEIVWQRLYDAGLKSVVRSRPGDFLLSGIAGLMKIAPDGSMVKCVHDLGPGQATAVTNQAGSTSVTLPSAVAGAVLRSYNITPQSLQMSSTWICPQSSADRCQLPQ